MYSCKSKKLAKFLLKIYFIIKNYGFVFSMFTQNI